MDGKQRPDADSSSQLELGHPRHDESLVIHSRRPVPRRRRSRLIEHGRADSAVMDPDEEGLILRSRRHRVR